MCGGRKRVTNMKDGKRSPSVLRNPWTSDLSAYSRSGTVPVTVVRRLFRMIVISIDSPGS